MVERLGLYMGLQYNGFLKIAFVQEVDVCVCMCVHVCVHPKAVDNY